MHCTEGWNSSVFEASEWVREWGIRELGGNDGLTEGADSAAKMALGMVVLVREGGSRITRTDRREPGWSSLPDGHRLATLTCKRGGMHCRGAME